MRQKRKSAVWAIITAWTGILCLGVLGSCSFDLHIGCGIFNLDGLEVVVSRSEGIAPLGVHFSAEFPGVEDASEGFLDYEYSWDFGDSDSGTWGTTGKS